MGISTEELNRRREVGADSATGVKTMLSALAGVKFVPRPPRVRIPGVSEHIAPVLPQSTQMALAMHRMGKPFYEGTVSSAVREDRRAKNRAARRARRVHRR